MGAWSNICEEGRGRWEDDNLQTFSIKIIHTEEMLKCVLHCIIVCVEPNCIHSYICVRYTECIVYIMSLFSVQCTVYSVSCTFVYVINGIYTLY